MNLLLRRANESELTILAHMNKQLIDDEGSPNPMTVMQLEGRMRGWMHSDWNIDLICNAEEIIGYSLYQYRKNEYVYDEDEVYLRQYYIKPDYRNQGFGQAGIELLLEYRFKDIKTIIIDVLACNTRGMGFWRKVGFIPYSTIMKINR